MSVNATQREMQLGHAARKAGRMVEALDHYRSAVEQEPDSAEANSVYGLMLLRIGRTGEAETPLRRAVEIAPKHVALRMNLAQWLAEANQLEAAVDLVAAIAAEEPQHAFVWERLGELRVRQRRFGEAAGNFQRATELQPRDPSLLFKLARASLDDGRVDDAERVLVEAAALAPGNPAILRLRADVQSARGNGVALERTAQAWLTAKPREPAAWRALAMAQWDAGDLIQARQSFRHALELGEREALHLATYARLCMSALEYESAGQALEQAEALEPELGLFLSAKAMYLMATGRQDEAEPYARRALAAAPGDPFSYKTLALVTRARFAPAEMAALEALVERADLGLVHRATAAFALADGREAKQDFDGAFAAYERANQFALEQGRLEGVLYDPASREMQVAELMSIFPSVPGEPGNGELPRPVFIVGMPRSGTTLIESVIGAHTQALACGERMPMRWILQDYLTRRQLAGGVQADSAAWAQWREAYWQGLPAGHDASVVTDKNPWNFDAIGLIARLFPQARVIHVRRNPVETCLSIYRNEFGKALPYTNRLEDIGHYYGQYARLMDHWGRVAAGRFVTIQYEDFARDFETSGPRLLGACGLDWEPGCRNFWESRRTIGTMSLIQARRPPELGQSRATHYGARLAPLTSALEKSGVNLETGAFNGRS